jgi:hypothetical protein
VVTVTVVILKLCAEKTLNTIHIYLQMIFLYSCIFSFIKHTNWRFLCDQVWNLGPSTVERAEIEIQIPHQYILPPVQEIFMRILEPQVSELSDTL